MADDPMSKDAEIARLREAIRRLADQDATLSIKGGDVIVTMDATLTDEEREAVAYAVSELDHWTHGSEVIEIANTLRKLLERLGGDR